MGKPVGVRVYHKDTGETETPEVEFVGFDAEGDEMWHIVGLLIRSDIDVVHVDELPANTSIGFYPARRTGWSL